MTNFLEYEKNNNRLIALLQNDLTKKQLFQNKLSKLHLIAPHDVSISKLKYNIPDSFVESHMMFKTDDLDSKENKDGVEHFVTLNGIMVKKIRKKNLKYILETEHEQNIHVLRQGKIQLYTEEIPLLLISVPLFYPSCDWLFLHPEKLKFKKKNLENVKRISHTRTKSLDSVPIVTTKQQPRNITQKKEKNHKPVSAEKKKRKKNYSMPFNNVIPKDITTKQVLSHSELKRLENYKDFTGTLKTKNDKKSQKLKNFIKKFLKKLESMDYSNEIPQIVRDFMNGITGRWLKRWKSEYDVSADVVSEHVEKYIMSKLHHKFFSPTMECVLRDNEINMRLQKLSKVLRPNNLDLSADITKNEKWEHAKQELTRINAYHTPRAKIICVSNCSKLIFQVLNDIKLQKDTNDGGTPSDTIPFGTDDFLPAFLYLVLETNPPNLNSNIQYISDFRDPEKLEGTEAGWCLTCLQSAVTYWESVDHTKLFNITESQFHDIIKSSGGNSEKSDVSKIRHGVGGGSNTNGNLSPGGLGYNMNGNLLLDNFDSSDGGSSTTISDGVGGNMMKKSKSFGGIIRPRGGNNVSVSGNSSSSDSDELLNEREKKNIDLILRKSKENEVNGKKKMIMSDGEMVGMVVEEVRKCKLNKENEVLKNVMFENLKISQIPSLLKEYRVLLKFFNNVKNITEKNM